MRMRLRALWLLSALSCGESTAPPAPCDGPLTVTVTHTLQPRIGWSPHCGVSELIVVAVPASSSEAERVVWGFTVSEQAPLGPDLTYGLKPRNSSVWKEPEALVVGKTYRVTVGYTVGGDVLVSGGSASFTWFPPD
jgi:hypothetical protein